MASLGMIVCVLSQSIRAGVVKLHVGSCPAGCGNVLSCVPARKAVRDNSQHLDQKVLSKSSSAFVAVPCSSSGMVQLAYCTASLGLCDSVLCIKAAVRHVTSMHRIARQM